MRFSIETIAGHSFVGSWLGPDSVVVDLGANVGGFSHEIQNRYRCRVAGVEANPTLARAIVKNDRLSCTNLAITANPGQIEFFIDPQNNEASTIDPQGRRAELQRVVVEGRTFVDFAKREGLTHIDLLKIDIEGAELDLLENMPNSVLQEIRQICVEFHAFIRPHDLPRIEAVIAAMRARNFFVLDFSRNLSNVLMINMQLSRLRASEQLVLRTTRVVQGVKRMAGRVTQRQARRTE
jgi:FkbM family methyltransferase